MAGGQEMHRFGRMVLRGESASTNDHQALRHRIHAEGEDHRRHSQIGDANAVDEAEQETAADAERYGESFSPMAPSCRSRRHHAPDGDEPRYREVDLAKKDDQHHAGRDETEEGPHLQLLQQIGGRQERRAAETDPGIGGAGNQDGLGSAHVWRATRALVQDTARRSQINASRAG